MKINGALCSAVERICQQRDTLSAPASTPDESHSYRESLPKPSVQSAPFSEAASAVSVLQFVRTADGD